MTASIYPENYDMNYSVHVYGNLENTHGYTLLKTFPNYTLWNDSNLSAARKPLVMHNVLLHMFKVDCSK